MDKFIIEGPVRLEGTVSASGAKNAVLPLMAASLLTSGVSTISNVPGLRDVRTFMMLLDMLGAKCELVDDLLTIDTTRIHSIVAPYDHVKKMRASVYVLGPLLAFKGESLVSLPGGCAWGPRPVNLHIEGMKALGAEIDVTEGYIHATSRGKRLSGGSYRFEPSSVGATCNVMMSAVLADGVTELQNCAIEPEVTQLVEALIDAGAKIEGAGTTTLKIEGVESLNPINQRVIPDRIEAGTFLTAAAMTRGDVTVENCCPDHMTALLDILKAMGCDIEITEDSVRCSISGKPTPVEVVTHPYPGFATDMQAQVMAVASVADGTSHITETIYPDRFTHAAELCRLGAEIRIDGAIATIDGVDVLNGAPVMATDLRASAAMVLAGFTANGETSIERVYHIDRGYERIEEKLAALGGVIRRVNE
ncbi:MAG: UDP-N-acetylglucosamine 1-carboxyvinyltransferase [bacterium]|nr:UDP-N-acetylglucosamine 1-carboxyvinyltransferase [bacterium]